MNHDTQVNLPEQRVVPIGYVNIVMALACEARPLLKELKLQKLEDIHEFSVFANAKGNIHLVVSGVGAVNAAAATAFLHVLTGRPAHACYLNIGIAGSGEHTIGELVVAHKIVDQASGQVWYPTLLAPVTRSAALLTVATPHSDYSNIALVDMEASGFFRVACRLVTQEQIYVGKIVSDTFTQTYQHITAAKVSELLQQQLLNLLKNINYYLQVSAKEAELSVETNAYVACMARWHFSVYQQHQLRELLRRWAVHLPTKDAVKVASQQNNAAQVLRYLAAYLDAAVY